MDKKMPLKDKLKALAERIPYFDRLDKQIRRVLAPLSIGIVLRVLRSGVSFVFNFLLARLLGAEGAGVYFLAYSVTTMATTIGRFGLDNAMLRFSAAHAANEDWSKVKGVWRSGIMVAAGVSTVATILIVLVADPIANVIFSDPRIVEPMRWMALSIVPWSLLILTAKMLQSLEKIKESLFIESVGVTLINIPLMAVAALQWGVVGVSITFVISTVIVLVISVIWWRKYTPHLREVAAETNLKPLLKTSSNLLVVDGLRPFVSLADNFMLGIVDNLAAVGIFNLVSRIAGLTSANLTVVGTVYSPKFAALYEKRSMFELRREARNSSLLSVVLALPYLVLIAVAPFWVGPVFGADYLPGIPALVILAAGKFIGTATGAVGTLLIMTGYDKEVRNIMITTSLMKLVLQILLIPTLGITGAAFADALSSSTRNIWGTVLVYRKMGMLTLPVPNRLIDGLPLVEPTVATD